MSKKNLLVILAVVTVIAVPFSVFAATSDAPAAKAVRSFLGIDASKLTDVQKADVESYSKKMADLKKEFINKMVENGSMTKEQGDAAVKRLDEMLEKGDTNGLLGGMGMMKGGPGGFAKRGGPGEKSFDTSKLTDQQKADLISIYKEMADLEKQSVEKVVSFGALTQEQGNTATAKIDESIKALDSKGLTTGNLMGKGGFGLFGFYRVDTSKLTDQQKTELKDISGKMSELQKKLTEKLVEFGVMTQEQGDAAIKRLDATSKYISENGFPKGGDVKKGHPREPKAKTTN